MPGCQFRGLDFGVGGHFRLRMLFYVRAENAHDPVLRKKELLLRQDFHGIIEPQPLLLGPIIPPLGDLLIPRLDEFLVSSPWHTDDSIYKITDFQRVHASILTRFTQKKRIRVDTLIIFIVKILQPIFS